ncbi:MAG: hypothetical protein VKQ33_16295, partial [Candidatus Sericytochromatia bacterium]|nr:hypothetical protein [Candidatus Sericytochromatia bacterium]
LTVGTLSISLDIPHPGALEAIARLRWRTRTGRWSSLTACGGGASHAEAAFHATFFALRRFLLGDVAVVGVLLANEAFRLELLAAAPLADRYDLVLELPQLRARSSLGGRSLQQPSRYQWSAVLEPPSNPRARTAYMRVLWGAAGMPHLLRSQRGHGLPRTGSVRLHRLVALLRGDPVQGNHVHHLNHFGPDNRAQNLLTVTPRQHALGLHGEPGSGARFHARFAPEPGGLADLVLELRRGDKSQAKERGHTKPGAAPAASGPSRQRSAPAPATSQLEASTLAGFGLRRDARRHAEALVHLLRLTDRPWSVSELAAIISLQEGSLRRLLKRLCGFGLVEAIAGSPQRYANCSRRQPTLPAG